MRRRLRRTGRFGTILAADQLGLPVSTTHVLSSGVAGTMAANHSGLQSRTLRNILLAWVLTLPATVFLGRCSSPALKRGRVAGSTVSAGRAPGRTTLLVSRPAF